MREDIAVFIFCLLSCRVWYLSHVCSPLWKDCNSNIGSEAGSWVEGGEAELTPQCSDPVLAESSRLTSPTSPFPGLATVSPPRAVTSAGPVEVREIAGSPGNWKKETWFFVFWVLFYSNFWKKTCFILQSLWVVTKNPRHHPQYSKENEGVPEKFKDETLGRQIVSYVGLRAKLYSLLMVDDELEVSKKVAGSGIKRHVLNRVLNHQRYLDCLNGLEIAVVREKTFKSKGHRLFTIETERNGGTCYDDKRYFFEDKCRTSLAYGHYALR